jgi:DNA-binding transcriptional ArsR family regulator
VSGLLGIKAIDKDFNMVKPELLRWSQGFALLSEPVRLGILKMLSGGPKSTNTLCQGLRQEDSALRHHLGLLRKGGLIQKKRQDRAVIYTAEKAGLKALAAAIAALTPR